MKQRIFTLLMLLALMVVAGSAWALNDRQVYPNGTYSYKLNDIKTSSAGGSINIAYAGDAAEIVTMTSATLSGTEPTWNIAGGSYTATFTIKFSASATIGSANLVVTVTDLDVTKACSNYINYSIQVMPLPTYSLAIVNVPGTYSDCQKRTGAGVGVGTDNTADALGTDIVGEVNTFKFTVTPKFTGIITDSKFDYKYKISIADNTNLNSFKVVGPDGSTEITYAGQTITHLNNTYSTGYTVITEDFTVTFNTTTGLTAQAILAQLSLTAGDAVLTATGNVTANATATTAGSDQATVTVGAVPSIGSFGN